MKMKHYQDTSREAWRSFMPVAAELDRAILSALSFSDETCQAIEVAIGREHQAVSGNLRHLVERGLVEDSGVSGKTRSGRRAIIWRLSGYARTGKKPELVEPQLALFVKERA